MRQTETQAVPLLQGVPASQPASCGLYMSTFSYLCLLQALKQHLQICQKLQRFSQHILITWSWSWVRLSLSAAVVSSVTLSVINRAAQVEVIISSIISDKWGLGAQLLPKQSAMLYCSNMWWWGRGGGILGWWQFEDDLKQMDARMANSLRAHVLQFLLQDDSCIRNGFHPLLLRASHYSFILFWPCSGFYHTDKSVMFHKFAALCRFH